MNNGRQTFGNSNSFLSARLRMSDSIQRKTLKLLSRPTVLCLLAGFWNARNSRASREARCTSRSGMYPEIKRKFVHGRTIHDIIVSVVNTDSEIQHAYYAESDYNIDTRSTIIS